MGVPLCVRAFPPVPCTAWGCVRRARPVMLLPLWCHLSVLRPRLGTRVGLARRVPRAAIGETAVLRMASCLGVDVAATIGVLLWCQLAPGGGGGDAMPWAPRALFPAMLLHAPWATTVAAPARGWVRLRRVRVLLRSLVAVSSFRGGVCVVLHTVGWLLGHTCFPTLH